MNKALLFFALLFFIPNISYADVTPQYRINNYEKQQDSQIRELINNYYSSINSKKYHKAFNMWRLDDNGRNFKNQSYNKFAKGFQNTKSSKVIIKYIEPIDAGMSHRNTNVHVKIIATDKRGYITNYSGYYYVSRIVLPEADKGWQIIDAKITRDKARLKD